MAKITEYPQATKLDTGDVLLKDGTGGTKKMLATDLAKELAPDVLGDIPGRVDDLEAAVEELNPVKDVNSIDLWEQGGIMSNAGSNVDSGNNYTRRIRTTKEIPDNVIQIVNTAPDGFGYAVGVYTDKSWTTANWLGFYDNSGTLRTSSPEWITGDTNISDVKAAAQIKRPTMTEFYYRLVGANSENTYMVNTAPSDSVSLKLIVNVEEKIEVDPTLTIEGMAADAKAAGDKIANLASRVQNSSIFIENEGFPLIITDAAEGRRFESVQIPFGTPQIGYGDPSPSNIRKLTPRTPAFYRCGSNLYTGEGDTPNTAYNSVGVIGPSSSGTKLTDHIPVSGESEIVLLAWSESSSVTYSAIQVGMYDADGNLLNGGTGFYNRNTSTGIFTDRIPLSDGTATVRVSFFGQWNLGVYAGSAVEDLTLTLPDGSVGGGVWDPVNGTLIVDRLYKSLDGTEGWVLPAGGIVGTNKAYFSLVIGEHGSAVNDSGICSHFMPVNITSSTTSVGQKIVNSSAIPASARLMIRPEDAADATVDTFKAWLAAQASAGTPVQVCWRLAEPVVYTVDAVDVVALDGVNTLFSNAWEYGAGYDVVAKIQLDTNTAFKNATDALEVLSPGIMGDAAITDWNEEGYISLSAETAILNRIIKPSGESHARHILLSAQEGDTFTITATGGLAARAYGFIAEDNTILAKASAPAAGTNNVILVNEIITAPAGTKWLIINDCSYPFTGRVFRGVSNATRNNTLPSMNQMSGIPVLELTGDTSRMTKDNKVTLNYSIFDRVGTCTVKWQGSSSVRYGKKNYTVTFDYKMDAYENWQNFKRNYGIVNGVTSGDYPVSYRDFCESNSYAKNSVVHYDGYFYRFTQDYPAKSELGWDDDIVQYAFPAVKTTDGTAYVPGTAEASKCSFRTWGRQKKYCFKANYIDASHARNIVNARLWGRMVAARIAMGEIADARADSPNYGAIDGFPCEIKINGISRGLYTFNIPKDAWTFDMDKENDKYFVVGGEDNSNSATKWMTATVVTDPTATGYGGDYEVEVGEDYAEAALTSINNAIAQANSAAAASDWETALADYVDINSVYDYFIFTCCIANNDALARNILYGTYDGTKWFMSAYDLDTTYGFNPYGTKIFRTEGERTNFAGAAAMHRLAQLMVAQSPAKLKARYDLWRNGGTVNGVTVPAILSNESVWNEFAQFLIDIPSRDYRIDRDLWPMIPGTEVMTVSNYMEYYRAHCKALDEEIEKLVGNSNG